ncbi:anti-sigma factor domain-containing protein [Lysobacter korlensis]|uniref:Anti-sigma factor domain-containing protein n=1 Tax=Lysobacter korlensis TaxID=553636 RepID=A0ABV6RPX2_9GAMM
MNTVDLGFEHDPPGDDLLAAEYVLGVLDRGARAQAQARAERERAFAQLVEDWEQRLAPLLAEIPPVEVSEHVWPRLRTRLGWASVERRPGLWNSVPFWRGASGAALAVAAALAVVAIRQPGEPPGPVQTPAPIATAPTPAAPPAEERAKPVVVLARDDGGAGWLAAIDTARKAITMTPVPTPTSPDGRVGELWLIPAGGSPRSLGFVSHELAHTVEVPDDLADALAAGAVLAVTLEPEQGIPHAAPTGPIVAKGEIGTI